MMESRRLYVGSLAYRWLAVPLLWALTAFWSVGLAQAAVADARVEAVQWPAWVERDGRRVPLQPGIALTPRDRLITGQNARLLIRLADGSVVKLGERAELTVESIGQRQGGVVEAFLGVGQGAFRFTTGLINKIRGKREVKIRVSSLTIGIRGTDVWGKSDSNRDLVLLIEGKVSVAHDQSGAPVIEQEMAKPFDYLVAQRGQPANLKVADPAQVAEWAKETELDATRPSGKVRGRYAANIVTVASEDEALALYGQLRDAGYPVRLRPISAPAAASAEVSDVATPGVLRYIVQVEQMDSRRGAEVLARELRQKIGPGR